MTQDDERWAGWMRETMLGYLSTARASGKEIPLTVLSVDGDQTGRWHHVVGAGTDAAVIRATIGKIVEQAATVRYGILVLFEVSTGTSDGGAEVRDVAVIVACDEWTAEAAAYELDGATVTPSTRFTMKTLEGVASQFAGLVGAEPENGLPA